MESVRINRYLAMCGLGSRRTCEKLVEDGRVTINGDRVSGLTARVVIGKDRVEVDGESAKPERELVVLLNKPRNVLCTKTDPMGRATIYDLLPLELKNLAHVGRLDRESEGLLVLTNAGTLTYKLTHPSSKVEKEYLVEIDHTFDVRDRQRMLEGIQTEEGMAFATGVEVLAHRLLRIILQQGIKRQIRLMLAELGYEVRQLVRTRIGNLEDAKLKPGKWRRLNEREIELLQKTKRVAKKSVGGIAPPPPTARSRRPAVQTMAQGPRRSPDGIGPRPVTGKPVKRGKPESQRTAIPKPAGKRSAAPAAKKSYAGPAAGKRAKFGPPSKPVRAKTPGTGPRRAAKKSSGRGNNRPR